MRVEKCETGENFFCLCILFACVMFNGLLISARLAVFFCCCSCWQRIDQNGDSECARPRKKKARCERNRIGARARLYAGGDGSNETTIGDKRENERDRE